MVAARVDIWTHVSVGPAQAYDLLCRLLVKRHIHPVYLPTQQSLLANCVHVQAGFCAKPALQEHILNKNDVKRK